MYALSLIAFLCRQGWLTMLDRLLPGQESKQQL